MKHGRHEHLIDLVPLDLTFHLYFAYLTGQKHSSEMLHSSVTSTILLLPLVTMLCDIKTASSVDTLCFSKSNFLTWNKKNSSNKKASVPKY